MKRIGFTMTLKKGNEAEYKRRHDEIWPELIRELESAGVRDYAIFLNPQTLTLFASQKVGEHHSVDELPGKDIVKKWWAYMADLMETNPDNSPVATELIQVFSMD